MTAWEILFLFFAFQAFLLSGLFFFKRETEFVYANRLFSLFLFLCGWLIIYNVLFWTKKLYELPFIHLNATYTLPLALLGPSFFLYLRNVVRGNRLKLKWDVIHLLPFLILLILNSSYYLLSSAAKLEVQQEKIYSQYLYNSVFVEIGLLLSMSLYGIFAAKTYFNQYKKGEDLRIWVQAIILCYAGCVLSYFSYYILVYLGILTLEQDYFITLLLCISVMTAAYFALNFPVIFHGKSIARVVPFIKYKKTGLSENHSLELKAQLLNLMDEEKPYLNRELRLDDLADQLGMARHHTSQIINEHFQTNFFDFINLYRIEEAIRLLETDKGDMNLSEIGFLSGFNNTVSFNKAFKKHKGVTPSSYRKEVFSSEVS